MTDSELLNPVVEALLDVMPDGERVQWAGRIQQIYDPSLKRAALIRYDEDDKPHRFTFDTVNYAHQIAFRLTGGTPIKSPAQWGTRQRITFDLNYTLMCATKRPELINTMLLAFTGLSDVQVTEFVTETLSVLRNDFLFVPDPKLPYDPLMQCFTIRFKLLNISEDIFRLLCNPTH